MRVWLATGHTNMRKGFDGLAPRAMPPMVMSLIGLATLSRKKGGVAVPAGKRPAPTPRPAPRSGG